MFFIHDTSCTCKSVCCFSHITLIYVLNSSYIIPWPPSVVPYGSEYLILVIQPLDIQGVRGWMPRFFQIFEKTIYSKEPKLTVAVHSYITEVLIELCAYFFLLLWQPQIHVGFTNNLHVLF